MGEVGKGSTGRTVHKSIYIYIYIYGEVRVLGLVCGGQIGLSWTGEAYTYNRGLIWSGTVGPLIRKDFGPINEVVLGLVYFGWVAANFLFCQILKFCEFCAIIYIESERDGLFFLKKFKNFQNPCSLKFEKSQNL